MASITTGGVTTALNIQSAESPTVFRVGTPRTISVGAVSVNLALTPTCRFISIITGAGTHIHYSIGSTAQTATGTSHYLKAGERLVLAVPPNANIAAIEGSAAGTLFITELLD